MRKITSVLDLTGVTGLTKIPMEIVKRICSERVDVERMWNLFGEKELIEITIDKVDIYINYVGGSSKPDNKLKEYVSYLYEEMIAYEFRRKDTEIKYVRAYMPKDIHEW